MRKILSCEFNLDTVCVELRLDDGTMLSIDCTLPSGYSALSSCPVGV